MNQAALAYAQAFAEWGFGVFSVWGTDDGVCRCPRGPACTSPGKHPIPIDGLKSATTDTQRVQRMLEAKGSQGQYGVVPAPNVIVLDVDGEGWQEKLRALGLPKTLAVQTANGVHLYFYWPPEYGPQPTRLYGWVVRSQEHPGYVIGPGSVHQSGTEYRIARMNGHDIHEMLGSISAFPRSALPDVDRTAITVGEGKRQPEDIKAGEGRHDYIRDAARYLRGRGFDEQAIYDIVWPINLRFPEPKTEEEVRRAIGNVGQFAPDAEPVDVASIPTSDLILDIATYRAAQPTSIEWVSPLAAYGYVSLVSGPPKSGKSTLIGNLLRARETNTVFLWGQPVPKGPTLLVTEEGGFAVVRKTEGLTRLHVMDRRMFILAGLSSLTHLLDVMQRWCGDQTERALVIVDTLAIWGTIKDENDASAANAAVAGMTLFAQLTQAATTLVHHARKGGGEHGEAIRGSNAIFGAVDHSAELSYGTTPLGDSRKLSLSGRLDFPETATLDFDRTTMTYSRSLVTQVEDFKLDQFPMDGSGVAGLTRKDAEELWDLGTASANKRLKQLVDEKRLVRADIRTPGDKTTHAEYWKTRPLLDLRPVGERMADIMKGDPDD